MPRAARPETGDAQLAHQLFERLRDRIVEGGYAPGSRLPMDALTAEFGVSKQPVTDALRRLETLGLVEIMPRSGCRVRQYSRDEARDFFGVFASFESDIAAAAALRHAPDELAGLEEALTLLHEVENAPDPSRRSRDYFTRNARFHQTIHRMARSPLVASLSQRLWYLSDFLMYGFAGTGAIADAVDERNHDHDLILAAIRSRNDVVAKAAMDHHIRSITALFTGSGPTPSRLRPPG